MVERGYERESIRCGCGCTSVLTTLTVGLALAFLNTAASIGVSAAIPFTDANITIAGCIGEKDKAISTLPDYVERRVGTNEDFINSSHTLTIGPIESCGVVVVGKQEGAPGIGLHIDIK